MERNVGHTNQNGPINSYKNTRELNLKTIHFKKNEIDNHDRQSYGLSASQTCESNNPEELYMKRVTIEPTLNNQSNDAYQTPHFSIKTVTVPHYKFIPSFGGSVVEASDSRKLATK